MNEYFSAAFWKGALDRAVKSVAQSLLLLWGADSGLDIVHVDWRGALAYAGGAAVLSLITSVLSAGAGDPGTTSMISGGR